MLNSPDYVTKSFLKAELKSALDKQTSVFDQKSKKYRDQILTKMDEVVGELQTMREESTIGTYQTRNLREDVDGHEKRIAKLEASTP